MAKGVIIGFILAFGCLALGAYLYFGMGLAPVATAAEPMPFETYLAKRGLKAVVHKASGLNSPVDASTWRDRLPCPFLEGAAFTGRDEN